MSTPTLAGETVEWDFACAAKLRNPDELARTGGVPVSGRGFAHSVAHESGEGTMWSGFVVLVELDSGELVSIPAVDANMRVIRKAPTS